MDGLKTLTASCIYSITRSGKEKPIKKAPSLVNLNVRILFLITKKLLHTTYRASQKKLFCVSIDLKNKTENEFQC